MGEKDHRIENLRALAIILVIFGHSIILYHKGWNLFITNVSAPALDVIKNFIDLIQMPLFICLSGFLYYFSKETILSKIIVKKSKRLLIPFVFFGLLWMIPIRCFIGYNGYVGKPFLSILWNGLFLGEDCGHLWFLPFLFLCFLFTSILIVILERVNFPSWLELLIILVIGYLMYIEWWRIPITIPGFIHIRNLFIYYFWFPVGYCLNAYKTKIHKYLYNYRWYTVALAVATSIGYLYGIISYMIIPRIFLIIALFLVMPNKSIKGMSIISTNSFGIYLFHSPLVYITYSFIPNANPIIVVGINFMIWGLIAYKLTTLIRKTPLKIFIGEG